MLRHNELMNKRRAQLERAFVDHDSYFLKVIITERTVEFTFSQATFLEIYGPIHRDINHYGRASRTTLYRHEQYAIPVLPAFRTGTPYDVCSCVQKQ